MKIVKGYAYYFMAGKSFEICEIIWIVAMQEMLRRVYQYTYVFFPFITHMFLRTKYVDLQHI